MQDTWQPRRHSDAKGKPRAARRRREHQELRLWESTLQHDRDMLVDAHLDARTVRPPLSFLHLVMLTVQACLHMLMTTILRNANMSKLC